MNFNYFFNLNLHFPKISLLFINIALLSTMSLVALPAHAANLFTGTLGDTTVDFSHDKYKATLKFLGGKCVRTKKFLFLNVDVYEAYVHVSDVSTIKKTDDEILNSIANQKTVAIRLKFLRDVDGQKITASFDEALKNNKIEKTPDLSKFFDIVKASGEAKKNTTLSLVGFSSEAEGETLIFEPAHENTSPQIIKVSPGFLKTLYSFWFGKQTESELEKLKSCLIK